MKQWRMRTTLMFSLLAVSLGLTVTCLFIIRATVQQEISKSLQADLDHSLSTFRNLANQRNRMLDREAALLADLAQPEGSDVDSGCAYDPGCQPGVLGHQRE